MGRLFAEAQMLKWALFCLAMALVAAFAQTAGLDVVTQVVAKVLCFGSLVMFVVFVALGGTSRRT